MKKAHRSRLKILFVIRAVEHYYYFKSIVENLCQRGHKVKALFDKGCSSKTLKDLNDIKIKDKIDFSWAPRGPVSKWRKILFHLRDLLSWQHYAKLIGQSSFYKERWEKYYLFFPFKIILRLPGGRSFLSSELVGKMIKLVDKLLPPEGKILTEICDFSPDVVVATPANMPFSSCDQEYLKAAKSFKIPTVIPVFSWDNLTTKGLIHFKPNVLLAWNKIQVDEAVKHHGINKAHIRITGAPLFDFWFTGRKPSATREEFCKVHGLNPDRPILIYFETSDSLTGDERWLVKLLSQELKKSQDSRLKNTQIIARPHPFKSCFKKFKYPNVFIIPKHESWPDTEASIQLYYDSLYYSCAAFGINTSGMIDAAIMDKPIISLLAERYRSTQIETEHFRHLVKNNVLKLVKTPQDFAEVLERILRGQDLHKKQRQSFVKKFIRPGGLKVSAGEMAAHEIEKVAVVKI